MEDIVCPMTLCKSHIYYPTLANTLLDTLDCGDLRTTPDTSHPQFRNLHLHGANDPKFRKLHQTQQAC
jgi:hypothetical protein